MATPLLTQIFEAYPAATYLVDGDVVVQLANRAGRALAALREGEPVPRRRGGDLLRCVHSTEHPDGCGRAAACRTCVVRGAVGAALETGSVARRPATLELHDGTGAVRSLTVLVSASPIELEEARLAVLTIEDVSELDRVRARPRAALPILEDEPLGRGV
jgi:hypothetical protein